jgi:hypothetical protein
VQQPADRAHQLVDLFGRVAGRAALALHAVTGVVVEQAEGDLVKRGLNGRASIPPPSIVRWVDAVLDNLVQGLKQSFLKAYADFCSTHCLHAFEADPGTYPAP